MAELWQALGQLFTALYHLVAGIHPAWLLLAAWVAWWLWGVNWRRAWPILAQGGWAPLVLLVAMVALVWSQVAPSTIDLFGIATLPNFWWQLGATGLIAGIALFCGWLQGVLGGAPAEIDLEPPAAAHDHAHAHGHH